LRGRLKRPPPENEMPQAFDMIFDFARCNAICEAQSLRQPGADVRVNAVPLVLPPPVVSVSGTMKTRPCRLFNAGHEVPGSHRFFAERLLNSERR